MFPKILIVIFIFFASLNFIIWDLFGDPSALITANNPQIHKRNITPKSFTFKTLEGKTITSESLKGKVIVLNFWASWCVPCTVEFPDLINLTKNYPDDIVFLALSVDETTDNAHRFVARFENMPQPNRIIGLDKNKAIAQDIFQTTMYPETYILDRNFIIRRYIVGVIDWASPEIKTDLEKFIAEKPD